MLNELELKQIELLYCYMVAIYNNNNKKTRVYPTNNRKQQKNKKPTIKTGYTNN